MCDTGDQCEYALKELARFGIVQSLPLKSRLAALRHTMQPASNSHGSSNEDKLLAHETMVSAASLLSLTDVEDGLQTELAAQEMEPVQVQQESELAVQQTELAAQEMDPAVQETKRMSQIKHETIAAQVERVRKGLGIADGIPFIEVIRLAAAKLGIEVAELPSFVLKLDLCLQAMEARTWYQPQSTVHLIVLSLLGDCSVEMVGVIERVRIRV